MDMKREETAVSAIVVSTLQRRVALATGRVQAMSRVAWLLVVAMVLLGGCNSRSFFDPSKTGAFRDTPTTIPVLDRLDVIEPADTLWSRATSPTADDLIPIVLDYKIAPGDVITISVFELIHPGQETIATRRIDAAGMFRMPELGDIPAAGLSVQELQDQIWRIVNDEIVVDPQVNVVLEEGGAFNYTMIGATPGVGLYTLRRGDFRLYEAIAVGGGIPTSTKTIFVIRQVSLSDQMEPQYRQQGAPSQPDQKPVDIDELINKMDEQSSSPGFFGTAEEMIDIDDLEPIRQNGQPLVDVDKLATPDEAIEDSDGDSFIYVPERNEWVRVRGGDGSGASGGAGAVPGNQSPMALERVIQIDANRLIQGDSTQNIVIRPFDKIYVEARSVGVVYIEGEISRPGVYNMPQNGDLTLSRLVAAAGGFGPLAIPERVDVTRKVGDNLEATITLDMAAIRNRTQPDVMLKPDDHIIIGTSWFATPLAIFRNGFRMTYGFGFLLDRNFGNDVFGAPPTNREF